MNFAPYQDTSPELERALSPPPTSRTSFDSSRVRSPPPSKAQAQTQAPYQDHALPPPGTFVGDYVPRATSNPPDRLQTLEAFQTSLPMRMDYEAMLAYLLLPPAGGVFLLLVEHKSDYVRFHAWQSSMLFTCIFILHIILSWSKALSWMLFTVDLLLIGFLTWHAYSDVEQLDHYEIPIVGSLHEAIEMNVRSCFRRYKPWGMFRNTISQAKGFLRTLMLDHDDREAFNGLKQAWICSRNVDLILRQKQEQFTGTYERRIAGQSCQHRDTLLSDFYKVSFFNSTIQPQSAFSHFPQHMSFKMGRKIRLGVLVPSSNTVVEPLTQLMTSSINIPDAIISVHFSRFLVIEISQSSAALKQFDLKHILRAAELLADAEVDVIGWCGTSAGWLGFDRDVSICKAIHDATGIPATSSTLALNKLLGVFEIEEFGLITPYLAAMNEAIIQNYAGIGKRITHECHMDITENTAIGEVTEQELNEMMHKMVADGATAVTIFCTNLHAAQLVPEWEKKYPDVVVFDSVAAVISDMLKLASINPRNVKGWGHMFDTSFAAAWY